MRILRISNPFWLVLLTVLCCAKLKAQIQKNNPITEATLEKLLIEKRKINTVLAAKERYKIQIFNGDLDRARKTINQFKQEFKDLDATIIFNTPNYKVWVGSFKTRIEAEKRLILIKEKYKNVLLIKPSK